MECQRARKWIVLFIIRDESDEQRRLTIKSNELSLSLADGFFPDLYRGRVEPEHEETWAKLQSLLSYAFFFSDCFIHLTITNFSQIRERLSHLKFEEKDNCAVFLKDKALQTTKFRPESSTDIISFTCDPRRRHTALGNKPGDKPCDKMTVTEM